MIKKYLVGGAVRDQIMGIRTNDFDYVVVGSSPDEMIKLGFKPIGRDFPVFLHPDSHEEYALARTEKKISKGYHGFEFYASPDVTLEEDLKRRDITMNAIAMDDSGQFIDPFKGIEDINNKIIRHISDAFAEDPLRVIRVARFKARFPDFAIHEKTFQLLKKIVKNKEIQALSAERVLDEIRKSFSDKNIIMMLEVLDNCGALEIILPNSHFSEIQGAANLFFTSSQASELNTDDQIILLLLILYLGDNEIEKGAIVNAKKLKLPARSQHLINLVSQHFLQLIDIDKADKKTQFDLILKVDFFRRPELLFSGLLLTKYLLNIKKKSHDLDAFMEKLKVFENDLSMTKFKIDPMFKGRELGQAIQKKRFEIFQKLS